jgi:hypothetical protein
MGAGFPAGEMDAIEPNDVYTGRSEAVSVGLNPAK